MADFDPTLFSHPDDVAPPPPEPTFHPFTRHNLTNFPERAELNVKLVGKHVLWSHCLWNAGIALAHYFEENTSIVAGKRCLELGAGAGLPSLVAAYLDASYVMMTEYPDQELVDNTADNIQLNIPASLQPKGYRWGDKDVSNLLTQVPQYDVIILADLIFNHSQHEALLWTCDRLLSENGEIYCVFSHHRPHKADRDLAFFELAKDTRYNNGKGFQVHFMMTQMHKPMFEVDYGDATVRSQVHFYKLIR